MYRWNGLGLCSGGIGARFLALAALGAAHVRLRYSVDGTALFWSSSESVPFQIHSDGSDDISDGSHAPAIRAAAARFGNYRLPGLHLYVTLEPCAMCAGAISFARIGKLIFAADDPKGGAIIHGPRFFEQPTCHWHTEIEQDLENAAQASALLTNFFIARR